MIELIGIDINSQGSYITEQKLMNKYWLWATPYDYDDTTAIN